VTIPAPFPGLVIRYSYLWHRENRAGQQEGRKDRPAAILMTAKGEANATRVYVLPITHAPPENGDISIEISHRIKRLIGLDAEPSWIVLDELNDFIWPGFDLTPVPGSDPPNYSYGVLPPTFYDQVREKFLALYDAHRVNATRRD
jgi:hypothetical protein